MIAQGCLLAVDINSNRTGYMFGGPSDARPRGSVWHMPGGDDLPRVCSALYNSISELSKLIRPKAIVIEAPLQMGQRSAHTALVLISLYGAACAAGHNASARVVPANVGTWRKYFIGRGDYRGEEAKELSLDRCSALGWDVANHDQAEACGLWAWGLSQCYREFRWQWSPLFAAGAAA